MSSRTQDIEMLFEGLGLSLTYAHDEHLPENLQMEGWRQAKFYARELCLIIDEIMRKK